MTKRIFRSIFFVAAAVLVACFAIIMGVTYEYLTVVQERSQRSELALAAAGVEKDGAEYFAGLSASDGRFTWVAADGSVIYDSRGDAASMENHAGRQEIIDALASGTGRSQRRSDTFGEKTLYLASRLSDGTVLRLAVAQVTVWRLVVGMLQPVCIVVAAALVLSAVLARRVSKRIVRPLNALDLDSPLENSAYEELTPLLTRIERQHRQINAQLEELRRKRLEFAAVTNSMSEGLILLNSSGVILSMNDAARRIFSAEGDCAGRDMLTVDRSLAMQRLLSEAGAGRRAEAVMELSGGAYQVDASPVVSGENAAGVCILAFDITEKARGEQLRREFSANVSHELKTPLHSIMGAAELLENGLVKSGDVPGFVSRIRAEASRLAALVEDIIRLSQLDEGADMPVEEADLSAIAREAAQSVSDAAGEKGIRLSVTGGEVRLTGVRRLLFEIAYNLCDNAVKYNVPGGEVDIKTEYLPDGSPALTVSDTGVGIPPEAQSRVFERFYRVDKSHSRAIGGTGLGLSIVKHAAQYHKARVQLESEPGRGTSIRVVFPPQTQSPPEPGENLHL